MDFKGFGKTVRYEKFMSEITITEKIDGTNAVIGVKKVVQFPDNAVYCYDLYDEIRCNQYLIKAGSKNRWLNSSSEGDNFGFYKWVAANAEELIKLGEGYHYGEWWGKGIQRGYGMEERVFSLFNPYIPDEKMPVCARRVPVIYSGEMEIDVDYQYYTVHNSIHYAMDKLRRNSMAAPGFNNPEGVMVYFHNPGILLKYPYEKARKGNPQ